MDCFRQWFAVFLVATSIAFAPNVAHAQSGVGTVAGRVTDRVSGEGLPGASVSVDGTTLTTATDRTGAFRLAGVPAGSRTIIVTYLGRPQERQAVTVTANAIATLDVAIGRERVFADEVTVVADAIMDGQARALNQQKSAPNIINVVSADQIGRFPDANAAEAAQRIPGLSIERDQGEGRYVLVRGTEARLNSMMINGERIPSPESEIRAVALDVIPADLLQAIEVSKALTADMDADAIGGAVNLVTRQAPERPLAMVTFSGGYNSLMSDAGQGSFNGIFGRRFRDSRIGALVSFSASRADRGSDNFEVAYDDGDLEELQIRDYTVDRRRYGINGTLDFRQSANSTYWVRGIWNRFSDQEYRRTAINLISDNELERELKDRLETQTISSASFGGRRLLRSGWDLDFSVSGSYASENEPDARYTVVKQEDLDFAPNVTPTSIDPDNIQANPLNEDIDEFELDGFSAEKNTTSDRDAVVSMNLRIPLRASASFAGFLKVGGKLRAKNKKTDTNTTEYETDDDVSFSSLVDRNFDPGSFIGGRYVPGPAVDPQAGRALLDRSDVESEFDFETDGGDFRARERIGAAYAMSELYIGSRMLLMPGIRLETTHLKYDGNEVTFDEDSDYASTRPVEGRDSYTEVLPNFHLKYALGDSSNVRAALTRTLARPNYYDLVPYQFVIEEDREIELGNPALRPTTSWNLDLMAERYLPSVGLVSGGVFYKKLNDYIYQSTFTGDRNGDRYDFLQPQNGEAASLVGAEVAVQTPFTFLPAPLNGLGVYANYTITDSTAKFPGRTVHSTLPGQSRHLGNLALWFERRGFSARMSVNFHGRFISEVGESVDEDVYYDNHTQVDLSLGQELNGRVRLFAEFLNLSNAPLRYYQGVSTRPIQEEYYKSWFNFGARMSF